MLIAVEWNSIVLRGLACKFFIACQLGIVDHNK